MFDTQIHELYQYLTKQELKDPFSIIKLDRKSSVQYITDKYTWILVPNQSKMTIENYKSKFKIKDTTHLFFINDLEFGLIQNTSLCRELNKDDNDIFKAFLDSCSKKDKEEGMVSLEDDFIYGLFDDEKLVAVSSLWNWGDVISDIGILVHPGYRKRGYAKTVCQTLMVNIDKKFVWRCDDVNKGSYRLAKSIGFIHTGLIQELVNIS